MIVTISRQFGAGGSEVARRVAAGLGWKLVDNDLIDRVAQQAGLPREEVARQEERAPGYLERLIRDMLLFARGDVVPVERVEECGREAGGVPHHLLDVVRGDGDVRALEQSSLDELDSGLDVDALRALGGPHIDLVLGDHQVAPFDELDAEAVTSQLCRLLESLASDEPPCLWIVEDLHFASREAIAALVALAGVAARTRALLLATTRPTSEAELAPLLAAERARRLELPRLGADQSLQLLREIAKDDALVRALGPSLVARADGNPFFLAEMLRELADRGVKFDEKGRNVLANGLITQIQGGQHVAIWPKDLALRAAVFPAPAWDKR